MTVRDTYPLSRMDECNDSLEDAAILLTINCISGYCQTDVPDVDQDNTTFSSHHDLIRPIRMPFRQENAAASLQRPMGIILTRVKRQSALGFS